MGGREVMRQQLLKLPDVGALRNVSIQVLPFGRCMRVGARRAVRPAGGRRPRTLRLC
ncbi:Scr1 family TA system antitoxin-like transcriptional regulator [Streptomyces sp. V4I2]|uniref:Scr1 family TA system antitoxin-like transcriptional regulator n=1 Tax=Streptomyces sp. V4I2 TaxID=3042280 RepID=UPI0027D917A6|nr:Scr1 family TA system antitoxin-like transcriptional regulator [Streptomyces sp. V4I2]